MKTLLRGSMAFLVIVSLVLPMVPAVVNSDPLTDDAMSLVYGGQEALDCGKIALLMEGLCYAAGGGWLACAIVTAGAYLGCLAANALVAE
ncbi:MAG: hypothetical protein WCW35_02595 [Bacteroidota bacterium]|jgi:hypothetical protein